MPISLAAAVYCWWLIENPNQRLDQILNLLLWVNGCWIGIAALVHTFKARENTLTPEQIRFVHRRSYGAVLQALCFAGPVAAFFINGTWVYGPAGAVMGGLFLLSIWLGSAGLVGRAQAMKQIEAEQQRLKERADRVASIEAMLPKASDQAVPSPQIQQTRPGPITKQPSSPVEVE
ncbi:MAG: hypothetical protein SNJ75_08710 [Gemmataceae bacterium]